MTNEKKISFIICYNNMDYLNECLYYIGRLSVPEGYVTETLPVEGATSMSEGYNYAMKESGCGIKIYLHQDVFIYDTDMLTRIVEALKDESIGLLGVVGSTSFDPEALYAYNWDVQSADVYLSSGIVRRQTENPARGMELIDVEALDGMFLATGKEIPWDERLSGWDFYDIAVCEKYKEAGYRVCAMITEKPAMIHMEGFSAPKSFEENRKKFCELYSGAGYHYGKQNGSETENVIIESFLQNEAEKPHAVSEFRELFRKLEELGGINAPHADIRTLSNMLQVALKDMEILGMSNIWPMRGYSEIKEFYEEILFLCLRKSYGCPEPDYGRIKELTEEGYISREAIEKIEKIYLDSL